MGNSRKWNICSQTNTMVKMIGITKETAERRGYFVQAEEFDFVIINGEKFSYEGIVLDEKYYITNFQKPLGNLYIENISGELNGIFFNYKSYPTVPWAIRPFSDFPNHGWANLKNFNKEPVIIKTLLCFTFMNPKKFIAVSSSEAVDIEEMEIMGRNRLNYENILSIDDKKFTLTRITNNFYDVLGKTIHILPETILNMRCPNPVNYLEIHRDRNCRYFYNSSGITIE